MAISRRKLLVGTGVGAGVIAVGGGATLLSDGLPSDPDTLLRIDALPSDDPTPGWFHTSQKRQPQPPLNGDAEAPWVVIGGGFTGLAAARQLALNFPNDQVILVEAQQVGFGTSGRNAGFLIDVPHDIGAPDYIGDQKIARNILHLNQTGQRILHDLVEQYDITGAQLRHVGKYQAAVEDSGIAVLEAYHGGLQKLGQPATLIDGKDLPDHIGTKFYRKALYTPGTMLAQPSGLVKGLADHLPENVTLYEDTPITAVEYEPQIVLHHPTGRIIARKLVLANNAFGTHFGFLQHRIIPIFTYGSLTRPLTKAEQDSIGGKDFWGVIPADPFGTTLRRTHDNRILVRNSFTFNEDGRHKPNATAKFRQSHRLSFERRFPTLKDVEFNYTWGGGLGMSRNGSSFFGELRKNVYGSLGCNGLGTVRGTAMGTLLADWLAGKHHELIDFLLAMETPSFNPPDPFLTMGVNFTLRQGMASAGLEA
ncbi:FAD-dependent oxidoreductase [Superficieibacter electus]|uniref:FAD-dependent oxidoreductase n=1 Tax=Superficieibacter electus TaxID=2022662 RepID=A0A2P5GVV3_9ENTR|nr:FAD-binding oxidoreductase [Superficieibacter electus]POP50671.1 FAD-dependent oxidoreductase [Superficieibacter electus]